MARPGHQKRGIRLFLSFFLILFFLLFQGFSLASFSPPDFERLAPISAQVQSPTGLTVDQQGRVYVAETTKNRVAIFSQSGKFLHAITGLSEPISVSVAANGHIYIGCKKTGNVSVFDSSFTYLFKLGQGDGEFGFPCAIVVDNASDKIFVADRKNSAVRIFNANGSFYASLGQPGNADGQFYMPLSLAIDPLAAELIVLDQQQRGDRFYGTMIKGARIQYFDLNGHFLRGYSKFGYNIEVGQLAQPVHVTVDEASRLYVTDSRRQKVLIYDNNDTFLGLIDDQNYSLRTPLGLNMSTTNRLYVSAYLANQVEVYGIDDYSAMDVTPPALTFQGVEGGTNPAVQNTTINNSGKASLNWTASSSDTWLNLTEISGTIPVSGSRPLEIRPNTTGLSPGIHRGSIDITMSGSVSETIHVELLLKPNPLQIGPSPIIFTAETGSTPASQTLSVSTGSIMNPVDWTAETDEGWLSISKSSGVTPADVRVYANSANLPAGSYAGTVTFADIGDDPAPVEIAVTLHLSDPGTPPVEPPELPPLGQNNDRKKWTITQVVPGTPLNGVWGSSTRNIFAVGAEGTILHNDGKKWRTMDSGTGHALYSVWGSFSDNVYAVGNNGLVLHYDGSDWTQVTAATEEALQDVIGTETHVLAVDTYGLILSDTLTASSESGVALRSIWGNSDSDIFVVGEAGTILHFNGAEWNSMNSDTSQWLNSVWGSAGSDVFAVGENGAIVHYDGTRWSTMDSGTSENLQSVWGGSDSDVFAVGASGLMLHFNGTDWNPVASGATVSLNDVWVSSKSAVYAVGDDGIIVNGKSKFPWLHFFTNTILVNAASNDEDDTTSDKGLTPTKLKKSDE